MKLITYYTETHEKMFNEYFLPSIKKEYDFNIISKKGTQYSLDGNYFSKGFNETTKNKIIFLYENLLTSNDDELILFSDVDIIFLNDINYYIKKYAHYDMVFQNGYGGYNTGFFILKNKEIIKNLLLLLIENCHLYENDQIALNSLIKNFNINKTIFDDKILSPAALIGPKIWNDEKLNIPEETLVFHACWCAGIENKTKLLEYVKSYRNSKTQI